MEFTELDFELWFIYEFAIPCISPLPPPYARPTAAPYAGAGDTWLAAWPRPRPNSPLAHGFGQTSSSWRPPSTPHAPPTPLLDTPVTPLPFPRSFSPLPSYPGRPFPQQVTPSSLSPHPPSLPIKGQLAPARTHSRRRPPLMPVSSSSPWRRRSASPLPKSAPHPNKFPSPH
jgi:hypothetical protein